MRQSSLATFWYCLMSSSINDSLQIPDLARCPRSIFAGSACWSSEKGTSSKLALSSYLLLVSTTLKLHVKSSDHSYKCGISVWTSLVKWQCCVRNYDWGLPLRAIVGSCHNFNTSIIGPRDSEISVSTRGAGNHIPQTNTHLSSGAMKRRSRTPGSVESTKPCCCVVARLDLVEYSRDRALRAFFVRTI